MSFFRSAEPSEAAPQASFRRRLVLSVAPAVVLALAALALIAWGTLRIALQRSAVDVLSAEAEEVVSDLTVANAALRATGHSWTEPHHRLAVRRVDPVFVQVFDVHNRLVRQSTNIDALPGTYPSRLLAAQTPYDWIPSLRTFTVGSNRFYYFVTPVRGPDDRPRGYVQVARFTPDHHTLVHRFGLGLLGLWALLSAGLVGLVAWTATRVLRPLQQITHEAQAVTSDHLDDRIDVPAHADRETVLLARALNGLLERVEQHVEALRAFTSNAAHELQTPLTVLQGHVEIALRRERDAASYKNTLRLLDRKMDDLTGTVRALLTLTRLDRGQSFEMHPVNVTALAHDEAADFRAAAEENGVTLQVHANGPVWVEGQPDLLREAVRNLVENAVKYTPSGRIDVYAAQADGRAQLRCVDTGIGIAPDELSKVGARFYRSDRANQVHASGSGLGLSIVRSIVERHDGTLQVNATAGEGSTFTLQFPATAALDDDGHKRTKPAQAAR